MQHALLREQVLAGFAHIPYSSIPVMLRMSRSITASHAEVTQCVRQLIKDGMLMKKPRTDRLPPLLIVTRNAINMLRQEEYVIMRSLSLYEQKSLDDAIADEHKFAQDQQTVINFFQVHIFASTLMIQDLLRKSTQENNMIYVNTVLAQLAWNNEIESICNQLMWKFIRVAQNHVWDLLDPNDSQQEQNVLATQEK